MKLRTAVVLASLTVCLHGCFFFYVPGSVVGGVSDAITGAEGGNCVGPNAKVGDKVRMPGGSIGTIKSLSGASTRCTNPEIPIRALVVFPEENNATAPAPIPQASQLGLNLPAGWDAKPLHPNMVSTGGVLYAINRTIDSGAILSAASRKGITDSMAYATTARANQANRLTDSQQSPVSETEINGKKTFRSEVTGTTKSGVRITYLLTLIEGTTEFAYLNTWTTAANFDNQKETLSRLAEKVTGL